MLVLLIIFMVTAPMMIHGANVSLPEATLNPIPSEKENLMVTIDIKQQVYINDLQVEMDFLKEKLARIIENRSDQEVYLKADKNVPYGLVVNVMAAIKGAGVEKLGMVTNPAEPDKKENEKKSKS
jgi:biopolymer transport protein TolR